MNNLSPDGFHMAVLAAECILDGRALIHGPGACRGFTVHLSPLIMERDYRVMEGPYFFNNFRVPASYVDIDDFVNGADYKVTDLLDVIDDANLCVVIPTPGTSLIGDDLTGAALRSKFKGTVVTLEDNHMSKPGHEGFDQTIAEIVKALCVKSEKVPDTVNILGLPATIEGWETTTEELKGYLKAMDLDVIAVVGGGSTVGDIRKSSSSCLNISVMPEFCRATAEQYAFYGVDTVFPEIPVGFASTESWIRCVSEAARKDPEPALEMLRKYERHAHKVLTKASFESWNTRCATYSIHVDSEIVLPLMKWLYDYLAMFPECVPIRHWWTPGYVDELRSFLSSIGREEALGVGVDERYSDVIFADGQSVRHLERRGLCTAGIDIWIPSEHRLMFIERPVLAARGALRLLDDIFYGL